jgi:hypothetical protein
VSVRYCFEKSICEYLIFYSGQNTETGSDMLTALNDYIASEDISCVGIYADGATDLVGQKKSFQVEVRKLLLT